MTTTSLPTRPLGTSGLDISTVGFGAWAVGGGAWAFGWGPQDDDESLDAMRRAVALGVNWIDTAAVYGLGHSEELVGRLLRGLPADERPLVFTKCGLVWNERDRMAAPVQTLAPESIRAEAEASLRRLGVERIDLYQFHWPDAGRHPHRRFVGGDGAIGGAGQSARGGSLQLRHRPAGALRAHPTRRLPSAALRRWFAARRPWRSSPGAREHGTGAICYSPMQSGLLTDRFDQARIAGLADDDWRRRSPEFQPPRLARNLALRDALRPVARRHGATVSAVAVAWTLAWPGVSGAIVGARSARQVEGWIGAAALQLTAADLDEIAVAVERTGAGAGPTRPTVAGVRTG